MKAFLNLNVKKYKIKIKSPKSDWVKYPYRGI